MTTEAPVRAGEAARAARRRAVLELVATAAIGSQEELAALLRRRGFAVTQATVSRDIADLGLVKAPRGDHHAYVTQRTFADDSAGGGAVAAGTGGAVAAGGIGMGAAENDRSFAHPGEVRLRRVLADYPVRVARSGLTLVLVSTPGTAAAIAQAIDESGFPEQVGTLAGDNTLLVLFADEPALERWRERLATIVAQDAADLPHADLTNTYP
jgi:transcriptional regulator of arginine metabolism